MGDKATAPCTRTENNPTQEFPIRFFVPILENLVRTVFFSFLGKQFLFAGKKPSWSKWRLLLLPSAVDGFIG